MVPPSGLLRILVTGLHVEGVVRGPFLGAEVFVCLEIYLILPGTDEPKAYKHLFLRRREHRDDREADGLHRQCRAPVLGENGEADVPVAVDVGVHGDVVADEDDLGRIERILGAELEAQAEPLAVVEGVGRSVQGDSPAAGEDCVIVTAGHDRTGVRLSLKFANLRCEILPLQGVLVHAHALRGILDDGHQFLL